MSTFVLVHSPLVGPATWAPVAGALRAAGHAVLVPAITPPADAAPPWLPGAVVEVVAEVRGSGHAGDPDLVLAGHSGAGRRLPAIGQGLRRAGLPARAYVFVDAGLPVEGRSARDTADPAFAALLDELTGADGLLPPWSQWWGPDAMTELVPDADRRAAIEAELRPVPAALFDERIILPAGWPDAPCAYLCFTYEAEATEAEALGWPVRRLAGSHLHLLDAPAEVAAALVGLVAEAEAA